MHSLHLLQVSVHRACQTRVSTMDSVQKTRRMKRVTCVSVNKDSLASDVWVSRQFSRGTPVFPGVTNGKIRDDLNRTSIGPRTV